MEIYKLLEKLEIVKDSKEFQDLFHVRAIKLDGHFVNDPCKSTEGAKTLQIGTLEIKL